MLVLIPYNQVTLRGGYLYVNGVKYPEKFLHERMDYNFGPVVVEEGHYFLMGDNRNNSADSRTSEIGMIDKRCVVGKAYVRIFPMNKFEVFENPRKK